jgi:negative regulator of replication initiation
MDEKISLEAIALYSDAYAEKVLKRTFASKEKINGQDILALCEVQQINLFIVRELFKGWKEETKKLKSPYFDYENAEVKEAMDTFMGILSKHIAINRQHFAPLLKKAVSQAVLIVLDPYDYFSMLVSGTHNKLDVAAFREEIKYLKINKAPLEKMLQKLEEKKLKEVSGNEAFAILDQILEEVSFTPDDVDDYIQKFSIIEKLDPDKFYVKKEAPVVAVKAAPANTPKPVKAEAQKQPEKVSTVNSTQKIQRIKERLTINQKFMFTKVLFKGDFETFSKAVDELDQQNNMPEALKYLEKFYVAWDKESQEFHEFMEIVERRFS